MDVILYALRNRWVDSGLNFGITLMKEGIQIKDSAIETTRNRRRGGTNFTGSKQKQRNNLRKREGTGVGISKTAQARKGKGKSSWRLWCDLEPINEDRKSRQIQ